MTSTANLPVIARSWRGVPLLLLVALALAGCKREEIKVYNAPKDNIAKEAPHAHWKLPAGWEEKPTGGMRVGSFSVSGSDGQKADISVIPLSGQAGGEVENVNRWRGQISLEPVSASQLSGLIEKVDVGKQPGSLYDLSGTNPESKKPERMLVATVAVGDTSWFFKMIGPLGLVEQQKPNFIQFLKSVSFHEGEAQAARQPAPAPPSPVPAPPMAAAGDRSLPEWNVPSHWKNTPASTMLLARFSMVDAGGKADVTVSAFPGAVGGMLANVNRWRGQIGLPPVGAEELTNLTTSIDLNGEKATLIDMTGAASDPSKPAQRLVTAVVQRGGKTWFFKILGDAPVVEKEKPAFVQFLQSIRFPNVP